MLYSLVTFAIRENQPLFVTPPGAQGTKGARYCVELSRKSVWEFCHGEDAEDEEDSLPESAAADTEGAAATADAAAAAATTRGRYQAQLVTTADIMEWYVRRCVLRLSAASLRVVLSFTAVPFAQDAGLCAPAPAVSAAATHHRHRPTDPGREGPGRPPWGHQGACRCALRSS